MSLYMLTANVLNASNASGVTETCAYHPDSGQLNPLGMRTFITVTEENGSTHFLYERFPQNIPSDTRMAISSSRTLVMYDTPIHKARSFMRENNQYYEELIGYKDPVGFSAYDEAMICHQSVR